MSYLADRALLANLSISQWTARKFDRTATLEVASAHNAPSNIGRYNKLLVHNPKLKTLQQLISEIRNGHYTRTLPWLDQGQRLLPVAGYFDYCKWLSAKKREFDAQVAQFIDEYPAAKDAARSLLNGLYNEADYPSVERLREKFSFDVAFSPVPESSSDFRVALNQEALDTLAADAQARAAKALDAAVGDAWQRLHTAVDHMARTLATKDKIFRDSLVGNVAELCDLLPVLNIGADPALDDLATKARQRLANLDPRQLRDDPKARRNAAREAQSIIDAIDKRLGL